MKINFDQNIDQIISNKIPCYFVSPHFDDAVFSSGELLSRLAGKTPVTIINLFTKAKSNQLTTSAKAFVKQCGYKDATKLFSDREIEDAIVLNTLGVKVVNLDFKDALFREKTGTLSRLVNKILPEFGHVYPTYRFHIIKGKPSKNDSELMTNIATKLKEIIKEENAVVFCPLGLGNHVDHVIAKQVCENTFNKVFFWEDYPYILQTKLKNKLGEELEVNVKNKTDLMAGYKSQYHAIFGQKAPIFIPEKYHTKAELKVEASIPKTWLKKLARNLKLLVKSPKDFLYSFKYGNKPIMHFQAYDSTANEVINNIKEQIRECGTNLKVHFIGSASLKLIGSKDLDFIIEAPTNDLETLQTRLAKSFGKPTKIRKQFVEWNTKIDGFDVEIRLEKQNSARIAWNLRLFNTLKDSEALQETYNNLKKYCDDLPEIEYRRIMMNFYNELLGYQNILNKKLHSIGILLFLLICGFVLILTAKGQPGSPNSQDLLQAQWTSAGPFELSPERGRFALTYSLIENKSFYFSQDLARFTVPDLGIKNNNYVSLFAPGVSFLIIPGYILGKMFGGSQIGSTLIISLFAVLNLALVINISKKLTKSTRAALLAGLTFLFATPAFSYAGSIYQHHISTFLILSALGLAISKLNYIKLTLIWIICATSIAVDYPNFFLLLPIAIYAGLSFFEIFKYEKGLKISFHYLKILTFIGMALPLAFFFWFNFKSYGNPMQLAGTVPGVAAIDENGNPTVPTYSAGKELENFVNPEQTQQKSAVRFFKTRNLLNGMYIHFVSRDRGMLFFTPVILVGFLGLWIMHKNGKTKDFILLSSSVTINILVYSMWGDPWGGWAFGSRYLIPAYALLAIASSIVIAKFSKSILFTLVFVTAFSMSVFVNTLGALTSNANPPKGEAEYLSNISGRLEKYSFDRNWEFLNDWKSKSFVYNSFAFKYMSPLQYYQAITGAIILLGLGTYLTISKDENEN